MGKDDLNYMCNLHEYKKKKTIAEDAISGCLFGGAIGDALGYPVEFSKYKNIIFEYGEEGITEFDLRHGGKAMISDDTQMTLYTANALLYGETQKNITDIDDKNIVDYIFKAYQNWYYTQISKEIGFDERICWIYNIDVLHASRAPGNTCMSAIATSDGMGSTENEINSSKGCGGVMRVAPIGCYYAIHGDAIKAIKIGAEAAALTHGHPLGYITSGFMSCLVYNIIKNKLDETKKSLLDVIYETMSSVKDIYGNNQYYIDLEKIIIKAINLSKEPNDDITAIEDIGEGWVAEEALAISIYSALRYENDFHKAMICSVNHGGDSDSTGAITGNILGAYLGLSNIDSDGSLINKLEAYDVIFEIAQDLANTDIQKDLKWLSKYVYCNYGE